MQKYIFQEIVPFIKSIFYPPNLEIKYILWRDWFKYFMNICFFAPKQTKSFNIMWW